MNLRECTLSFGRFRLNMLRLEHFARASTEIDPLLRARTRDLQTYSRRLAGKRVRDWKAFDRQLERLTRAKALVSELEDRHFSILEWVPVMLVTFTEAYLIQVLDHVAAKTKPAMSKSECNSVVGEIRKGQPRHWPQRLPAMLRFPAYQYPTDSQVTIELIWDVRHQVVHSAGYITPDFVKRHPQFPTPERKRIQVDLTQATSWESTAINFVTAIDHAIVEITNPNPDVVNRLRNANRARWVSQRYRIGRL